MLQSLIKSKILVVGVEGEDLTCVDFLGAIWEKSMFFKRSFLGNDSEEKYFVWRLGDSQKLEFKEIRMQKGKEKERVKCWKYLN